MTEEQAERLLRMAEPVYLKNAMVAFADLARYSDLQDGLAAGIVERLSELVSDYVFAFGAAEERNLSARNVISIDAAKHEERIGTGLTSDFA